MRHCSPVCAGWWPFVLLPTLLLLPVLLFKAPSIERSVAANAKCALAQQHPWASAETYNRGRDVLVTGTAPNQSTVDQAVSLVADAAGVRQVRFVGRIAKTLNPARITLDFRDNAIVLGGVVDSQSTIDLLRASASGGYGNRTVIVDLQADPDTAQPPDLGWLFPATSALADGNSLEVAGNKLTIRGEVNNERIKFALNNQLSSNFNGVVDNQLSIAIDHEAICIAKLNKLLANTKINFESGSATIEAQSFALLDVLAKTAVSCKNARFEVAGHTDSMGREQFNLSLSQRRAQAVIDYFVGAGLEAANLVARGYGSSRPLADNNTGTGRATNRRIEFNIITRPPAD